MSEVTFRTMQSQADAAAFEALNTEWIVKLFRLEEKDREVLSDPHGKIVAPGGQVYMALLDGRVVGTVALNRFSTGVFELTKMAVSPEARGNGVGRKLLHFVLTQAPLLGAKTVVLGSSTRLKNAVHLYQSLGFRHVPQSDLEGMKYERADVFMKLDLF